jgi:hypothetical protein
MFIAECGAVSALIPLLHSLEDVVKMNAASALSFLSEQGM